VHGVHGDRRRVCVVLACHSAEDMARRSKSCTQYMQCMRHKTCPVGNLRQYQQPAVKLVC
jgi:hypothetical protein